MVRTPLAGWAFPESAPERFYQTSAVIKAEWEAYLAAQPGLTPADFGQTSWDQVLAGRHSIDTCIGSLIHLNFIAALTCLCVASTNIFSTTSVFVLSNILTATLLPTNIHCLRAGSSQLYTVWGTRAHRKSILLPHCAVFRCFHSSRVCSRHGCPRERLLQRHARLCEFQQLCRAELHAASRERK